MGIGAASFLLLGEAGIFALTCARTERCQTTGLKTAKRTTNFTNPRSKEEQVRPLFRTPRPTTNSLDFVLSWDAAQVPGGVLEWSWT